MWMFTLLKGFAERVTVKSSASSANEMRKGLGGLTARALAYEKSVGFIFLRKIREP